MLIPHGTVDKTLSREEILNFNKTRYATKKFDANKDISDEDLQLFREVIQLSPTSFGFEEAEYLFIKDRNVRAKMQPVSWNQPQIMDASMIVVALARKAYFMAPGSDYLKDYARDIKGMDEKMQEGIAATWKNFVANDLETFKHDPTHYEHSSRQAYIQLAHLSMAATQRGLDTCWLEGFSQRKLEEVLSSELNINMGHYGIAVMMAVGYRNEAPHRDKTRKPIDEISRVI